MSQYTKVLDVSFRGSIYDGYNIEYVHEIPLIFLNVALRRNLIVWYSSRSRRYLTELVLGSPNCYYYVLNVVVDDRSSQSFGL